MWVMSVIGYDGDVMSLLQDVVVILVISDTGCDCDVDDVCYRM